jgi:hypothetical protein
MHVVVGQSLYGYRIKRFVDKTYKPRRGAEVEWWDHAQCRLEPR